MTSWSLTRESLSGTRRSSSRREIVLDTNGLSKEMRPVPDAAVHHWFLSQHAHDVYTAAITEAEILHGIALVPSGKRKQALGTAAARVLGLFGGRVLPYDSAAARGLPTSSCAAADWVGR